MNLEDDNPRTLLESHGITTEIDVFLITSPYSREPREVATRAVIPHVEPCWHCSKPLAPCNKDGRARFVLPLRTYHGPTLAYVVTIMGHDRKLHGRCAEVLGYKLEERR